MNVPLLDLKPQMTRLRPLILEAMTRVLDSTAYILGREVTDFEEQVARYCQSGHGIGVSSGTDALLASLMSLDVGSGDLVLTTPYSFFATMGTILRVGALPVFADIDPDSFNIDPKAIETILEADRRDGRRIKAIIPVHLYGQCADMQAINRLAAQYDVAVIEDAAQAIGAEFPATNDDGETIWQRAGSMGLAGCFSFFPSKNLGGIGDGGMITTSDPAFADIVRSNRNHGAEPKYYHSRVGGNFRLDPIQAAVLAIKLQYLEEWHKGRQRNAERYRRLFADAKLANDPVLLPQAVYASCPDAPRHNHHIYNQFVIRVPKRDALRVYLQENGIGCEIYYPLCLHQQECLKEPSFHRQRFPVAEAAAGSSLALPIYPELTEDHLTTVVEAIQRFYHSA